MKKQTQTEAEIEALRKRQRMGVMTLKEMKRLATLEKKR
jgi:hypothetical protein